MSYANVEMDIIIWAQNRKIIPNSTPQAQFMKAVSEMGELSDGLTKGDMHLIEDSVGDVMVCLVNMCALLDISLVGCMEKAYEQIKDRRGTMMPSGVFVKE